MNTKGAQEDLAPGSELGTGTAEKMLLRIGFVAGRAVVGRGTPFGFLILGREAVMIELE
jgi:hypothetical protein